ncbi:MAG: mechanosensitive ion channel family protein [Muribaculaceae bacterium]|nr:mechanosensitive ion channel family protein [Muribaculaceae bacterium]
MERAVTDILNSLFSPTISEKVLFPVTLITIFVLAVIAYVACRRLVIPLILTITKRTNTEWDDDLLTKKVLSAGSQLAPALLFSAILPKTFTDGSTLQIWITKATELYILVAIINLLNQVLQAFFDALDKRNSGKVHTLRGVLQMIKLFFIIIGVIIGISILIGKNPLTIIAALGASAAVLMLIFQDTILGLVAGVQLTVNEMLKKGDWIVVSKANANGEVIEISLTTVKVRNWDNSVTTVPPYTLIKESFQNFSPMQESGGRRISRSIYLDFDSIRFLTDAEINDLKDRQFLTGINLESHTRVSNITLLSQHLEYCLTHHNDVNKEMMIMVRQLQPTPQGLPLELYFFSADTQWKNYEHLQARIFDYVYAVVKEFHLSIYQAPSGKDIKHLNVGNV